MNPHIIVKDHCVAGPAVQWYSHFSELYMSNASQTLSKSSQICFGQNGQKYLGYL